MASEEEIRKIEKQVLEEYKEIEFRVRERVPEYDKTYLNCQHLIEKLEQCYSDQSLIRTHLPCVKEERAVQQCTNQATCPKEFLALQDCMNHDRRKCYPLTVTLKSCLTNVAQKVKDVTKEELKLLREREAKQN